MTCDSNINMLAVHDVAPLEFTADGATQRLEDWLRTASDLQRRDVLPPGLTPAEAGGFIQQL